MKQSEIHEIARHLKIAAEIAENTAKNTEDDGYCIHTSITLYIDNCHNSTYDKIAKLAGLYNSGGNFDMGVPLQGSCQLQGYKDAYFYLVGVLPNYRWIFEYSPDEYENNSNQI